MKNRKPKIIVWDIETLPNLMEVMKVFPGMSDYPGLSLKATHNSIICVGWKEYGSRKINCINAWDFKRWKKDINDDRDVVKAAYEVLKDADVVVTHNGKRFDWKFLQTRLLYHGLQPLPKIIHIDTKCEAKKHLFAFNNRLNTVGQLLAKDEKMKHSGWPLWVDVLNRKRSAMKKMTAYCKQDVALLEKVFTVLRPLLTSMPNANLFNGKMRTCPTCGSTNVQRRGEIVTKSQRYFRYQCRDCGSWSQESKIYGRKLK